MHYKLMPLHKHSDRGFGAVADSFKDAGDLVSSADESKGLDAHLPASFLYRHAIELYLKSGIIILLRQFSINKGEGSDDEPKFLVNGKWKPMHNVHGLAVLHERLRGLFAEHENYLREQTRTDWSLPDELASWIDTIEAMDGSSTFFRYPVTKHATKDAEKSPMKESDPAEILARFGTDFPSQKVFLVIGQGDEITQAFYRDESQTAALLESLRKASNCLHNLHAALRGELTRGW